VDHDFWSPFVGNDKHGVLYPACHPNNPKHGSAHCEDDKNARFTYD